MNHLLFFHVIECGFAIGGPVAVLCARSALGRSQQMDVSDHQIPIRSGGVTLG